MDDIIQGDPFEKAQNENSITRKPQATQISNFPHILSKIGRFHWNRSLEEKAIYTNIVELHPKMAPVGGSTKAICV